MSTEHKERDSVKRILVVDDNLMSRKVVLYRLEQMGYNAASAASGNEALTLCSYKKPNLILLDLVMNGLDGLDVLRTLKSTQDFKDIPVVMISGVEELDAISECLNEGASGFLQKPVQAETLSEVVIDLIGVPTGDAD